MQGGAGGPNSHQGQDERRPHPLEPPLRLLAEPLHFLLLAEPMHLLLLAEPLLAEPLEPPLRLLLLLAEPLHLRLQHRVLPLRLRRP